MALIGAHVLNGGTIINRLKYLNSINGNVLQIYLGNPRSWKQKSHIEEEEASEIKDYLEKYNIKLFVHLRLNINICKEDKSMLEALIQELNTIHMISGEGGILHLGKRTGQKLEEALLTTINNLNYVKSKIKNPQGLIIETSSGQGSETGVKLEELSIILDNVKDIGVCVDTAHIFAAGYDIRTKEGVKSYFEKFDKLIGINKIKLVHLNDSKKKLDSRVDRHEMLREGYIFKEDISGLEEICNFCKSKSIPMVLETKSDDSVKNGFQQEIMLVKSILGELESQKMAEDYDNVIEYKENILLSELLFEIAKYEKADNVFKSRAYENVAIELKNYNKKIKNIKKLKEDITGIGKSIQTDIEQFLETGKIQKLEEFRKRPENDFIYNFENIDGFGPKIAKKLVNEYNLENIYDLRKIVDEGKIKLTKAQILGLKYYEDTIEKIPRKEIDKFQDFLHSNIKNLKFEITGSYRRNKKRSGDIDILITGDPEYDWIDYMVSLLDKYKFLIDTISIGETKFMGYIKINKTVRRIDIRSVEPEDWAPALLYFTGSKEFNIQMRQKAIELGLKLNEYGLFKNDKKIKLKTEKDIFEYMGLEYIKPEDR